MSESKELAAFSSAEGAALNRAVRFVMAALVAAADSPNLLLAAKIDLFRRMLGELLHGKPLPYASSLIIEAQPWLIVLSLLVPVAAVAACFVPRLPAVMYIFGSLILIAALQTLVTCALLALPLITVFGLL